MRTNLQWRWRGKKKRIISRTCTWTDQRSELDFLHTFIVFHGKDKFIYIRTPGLLLKCSLDSESWLHLASSFRGPCVPCAAMIKSKCCPIWGSKSLGYHHDGRKRAEANAWFMFGCSFRANSVVQHPNYLAIRAVFVFNLRWNNIWALRQRVRKIETFFTAINVAERGAHEIYIVYPFVAACQINGMLDLLCRWPCDAQSASLNCYPTKINYELRARCYTSSAVALNGSEKSVKINVLIEYC